MDKKIFFIENSESEAVTCYPFSFYKNLSNSEFHSIYFNASVQNYRDKLNQLKLTIIITDKILLDQKMLGLPIKKIQTFFNVNNTFINIKKFKDNKIFF